MLHRLTLFITGSILVGFGNYAAIAQETPQVAFSNVNPGTVEPMLGNMKILDRKSTRLNSSHSGETRMPSSA